MPVASSADRAGAAAAPRPRVASLPAVPLVLTALFVALTALPRVHENPKLLAAFGAAAGLLLGWALLLWALPATRRRGFAIELVRPLPTHYVQASLQVCIYIYWGWYWRPVYAQWPLYLAQLLFLYAFDALLTWSRGRAWRPGFGALPIVLSTNIFLWFLDDWFALQFLMVAVGALGKEFIRWTRDGRRVHIFNPSAFTLAVFSIGLLALGATDITWARSIATTVTAPPHIYVEVFLLGLVVQALFRVTLVTFSAVLMLIAVNVAFKAVTGVYFFVDTNIPVPVFIGLTFLVTDPVTSPRTNLGRILFGAGYGLLTATIARTFGHFGLPTLYDKLLPIPLLNLAAPWLDRITRAGFAGRFTRWEARFDPRRLNLVHMGCWSAVFVTMLGIGWIEAPHPGASIRFWKKAAEEDRPTAKRALLILLDTQIGRGSGDAWSELGLMYLEGKLLDRNPAAAVDAFGRGALMGSRLACVNLVTLHVFQRMDVPTQWLDIALDTLEGLADRDGRAAFLVGAATESGRGRPPDPLRARALYEQACKLGEPDGCERLKQIGPAPDAPR